MKTLKSKIANEESLRNSIYTELLNFGIDFPESAHAAGLAVTLRRAVFKNQIYSESTLAFLFAEFEAKWWSNAQTSTEMERLMQRLPVTTSSKPDATVIVQTSTEINASTSQLIFAEFKNHSTYSMADSVDQCALYLYALLFWLRAKCGLKVEVVYGFCFCGRKCKDRNGD